MKIIRINKECKIGDKILIKSIDELKKLKSYTARIDVCAEKKFIVLNIILGRAYVSVIGGNQPDFYFFKEEYIVL